MNLKKVTLLLAVAGLCIAALPAQASLTVFQQYVGDYGYAQSGCGSVTQSCTINIASGTIPVGATIQNAYLYTAQYSFSGSFAPSGTLNGTSVAYGPLVSQSPSCCGLASARADVTSIVSANWNSGTGAFTNPFSVTEGGGETTSTGTDGEALVIVYKYNDSTIHNTVGLLDGFSNTVADHSSITFTAPLNGFARMSIADSFSCCGQNSTITVNGTVITTNAGNNDDNQDASLSNGNLITSGGPGSPYGLNSACSPSYADDHEYYDLVACAGVTGATTINVDTHNPSGDDNIFEESFWVSGTANITGTPEPGTLVMFGSGVLGLAGLLRRKFNV